MPIISFISAWIMVCSEEAMRHVMSGLILTYSLEYIKLCFCKSNAYQCIIFATSELIKFQIRHDFTRASHL